MTRSKRASIALRKRIDMPKQLAQERKYNFQEVALGYSHDQAKAEAERCLQCKRPKCVEGCPVGVDIPEFIQALKSGEMSQAVVALKAKNNLPGICGRVCPQEVQCEQRCVLGKKGDPVAIGPLERYVADWDLCQDKSAWREKATPTGKKVAVVGSGPASLTCAADLARIGHEVIILEALHDAGGVLIYGIPEFRLPRGIVKSEIEYIKSLGVKLNLDVVVGRQIQVKELLEDGFDAVFLGIGAGAPRFLNIPGENLSGIYSANEYLTRINLMKAYRFPDYDTPVQKGKIVAVVGGGNVAMDAARCALRLGANEVHLIYRRSRQEMPARRGEIENAEDEGVIFDYLTNPTRFIGDERGRVKAMEIVQMELGEADESGRRIPRIKKGSEHIMPVEIVIIAVGTAPNPLISSCTPELKITKWGTLVVDERCRTTMPGVWAGGDITSGGATVIGAMGAGKTAASDMDKWLRMEGK
jgi:glutamate synthase (NADPH) small chain